MSNIVKVKGMEVKLVDLNEEFIESAKEAIKENTLKLSLGFKTEADGREYAHSINYFTEDGGAPGHKTELLNVGEDFLNVKFNDFSFEFSVKSEYEEVFLSPDTQFLLTGSTWTGGGANIIVDSLKSETVIKKTNWGDYKETTHFIELEIT